MKPEPIATTVVTGATGAGKTKLIAHLLSQRTVSERWAVLENDAGTVTLDRAPGVSEGEVAVRQVAGCICCTARVALRTGLIALVRAARPRRLLIEASALAVPEAIYGVLREPGIAGALDLRALLCVVAARQLADRRYLESEVYRRQIETADVIVLGDADAAERDAARAALTGMMTPRARVVTLAAARVQEIA